MTTIEYPEAFKLQPYPLWFSRPTGLTDGPPWRLVVFWEITAHGVTAYGADPTDYWTDDERQKDKFKYTADPQLVKNENTQYVVRNVTNGKERDS